jgi:anti-sigma factor RsiW
VTRLPDPDLMQLADGELDGDDARRAAAEVAAQPEAQARLDAVHELGELVRGHLELAADDADDRLAGLWRAVEDRLDGEPAPARRDPGPARPGVWARLAGWLDGHRGSVLTGLVSAGAVAAIMLWLRPAHDRVITRTVSIPAPPTHVVPASLGRQSPQVESLDTPGGTGTVFTFEDDDGGTAVILVTPNDVEGT